MVAQSCFSHHIQSITERATAKLKILKALSETNWEQHKVTTIITYRSLILSLIIYTAPVRALSTVDSNITKLKPIQNVALLIETGCHETTIV